VRYRTNTRLNESLRSLLPRLPEIGGVHEAAQNNGRSRYAIDIYSVVIIAKFSGGATANLKF
jgi:hypothetical protein